MIAAQNILQNVKVGISTSGNHELEWLGYGDAHLNDAAIEFARHLLYYGADLVYGHDLRDKKRGGYGWMFKEVAKNYSPRGTRTKRRVSNYLAYPFFAHISRSARREFDKYGFHLVKAKLDDNLDDQTLADLELSMFERFTNDLGRDIWIPRAKSIEAQYAWALSLSQMRLEMSTFTDARVFLGGRIHPGENGFVGLMPGVLEEGWKAIKSEKPIYLIGAFGGATRAMIEALQGKNPDELTEEFQVNQFPGYGDFLKLYRSRQGADSVNYEQIAKEFEELGIKGLSKRNGLTEDENERLFETPHISEMVRLVLKGMTTVFSKKK